MSALRMAISGASWILNGTKIILDSRAINLSGRRSGSILLSSLSADLRSLGCLAPFARHRSELPILI